MKGLGKWLMQLIISVLAIFVMSGLPIIIAGLQQRQLLFKEANDMVIQAVKNLFPLKDYVYKFDQGWAGIKEYTYENTLSNYVEYSLQILGLALAVAILLAIVGTFITMLFKDKTRQRIKMVFYFLESMPDILVIVLAQLAIITIFKQTGVLLSKIAVIQDERIYWLPVLCLMILPMIQLYRLSMLTFESEERKLYVEFARSLGFGKLIILFFHIFRNAIISVFFQSKKTMWFMLSNLFILELMFNMPGIMNFLAEHLSVEIFLLTVFVFFVPVFILYSIGEWYFLRRVAKGGVSI